MSLSTIQATAPLSLAQERFLLVNRRVGNVPLHNSPVGWRIRGPLDADLLARALDFLVDRHAVLRTRFPVLENGEGVQEVLPGWHPRLEIVPVPGETDGARAEGLSRWREEIAARPFRLTEEPGFRASLARLGPEDHSLLLVFHHIAFDGWSYGVVVRDLGAAYTAFEKRTEPELPLLSLQYADYAAAQREWVEGEEADRQRERWAGILAGVPAEIELPADRERPLHPSYRVERLRHVIAAEFRSTFEQFARANRATPFMILMAVLQALIGGYTGRRDFVIGFPLANRKDRADLGDLVGCFINILLLRADLNGEPTFLDLVRRVKRAAFTAFPYQRLPFDEVVKIVRPVRGLSQVMFNFRDYDNPPLRLGTLECADLDYVPGTSAVDLSLDVIAFHEGPLVLDFEYARDLFDRSTMERFAADYEACLREAVTTADRPLRIASHPGMGSRELPVARIPSADLEVHAPTRDDAHLSEVERVLVPVWEEALGRAGIGTRDDFFELGGQSLQAIHLIHGAERALGRAVPLGWIFEHPTIERLAAAIEKQGLRRTHGTEFLIPISAGGSLPPLFCVHGGGGGVFAYREVAKLLGPDQPVYGFMLLGTPLDRVPLSVEAMAGRYLEEIRQLQSEGPYRLVGYSFGSLVAYEMARRLKASGEPVDLTCIVVPPRKLPALRPVWRRLRSRKIRALSRRTPSIFRICTAATYNYDPLPYPGRIVLFETGGSGRAGRRLWRRLAKGGLDVHVLPGGHLTIMRGPNAPEVAGAIRRALEIVDRPALSSNRDPL